MITEYMGHPKALFMLVGDDFGRALACEFRKRKWNIGLIQPTNRLRQCDILIIKGGRHPDIVKTYTDAGIPVFVYDWGYFCRPTSQKDEKFYHHQLSYQSLNNIPKWRLPSDRLNAIDAVLKPRSNDKNGYVLLCGQMPADAAVLGTDHKQWLIDRYEYYTSLGYTVKYREHPRGGVELDYPKADDDLLTAMKGSRFIVTYNSNVGHEALMNGIPVICDKCAPYHELSGEDLPNKTKRMDYFSRAAYGQWKVSEAKEAVQFLLTEWLPRLSYNTQN